jgi:hypothetical protein
MKTPRKQIRKNLSQIHEVLVDQLVKDAGPVKCVPSAVTQWLEWMALSLAAMAGVVGFLHSGPGFWEELMNPGSTLFILMTLAGSAIAAWGAILSSLPGRCCKAWRLPIIVIMGGLVLVSVFFFHSTARLVEGCVLNSSWDFFLVFFVGFIPWSLLGFRLSRNAAFNPIITGTWSGLSALLMATCTLYICCPCGSMGHMFVNHLLPVVAGTLLTASTGAFWFSRWDKKPKPSNDK